MALSVVGAGYGRTGTASLKLALEQLGFGPCHHMSEVRRRPGQLEHWEAAAAGEAVDWNAVFAGFRSAVDWPSAAFWRELATFYPDARVLLSVRPAERWWKSFSGTIKTLLDDPPANPEPTIHRLRAMSRSVIADRSLKGVYDDADAAIAAFDRHVAEVQAALPAGRLLVFDVAEGWEPLCRFLDVPVPDTPFPRTNSTDEFWDKIRSTR
jgi:hypothetical protein